MRHGLDVTEYSPKKVKQAVTGNGNASKEQVMKMLQMLLHFKDNPKQYDATDALAVAFCHHLETSGMGKIKLSKSKSWDDFIKQNPSRVAQKK
jgi:crossover junction endodeoxyribonuclease RuvC